MILLTSEPCPWCTALAVDFEETSNYRWGAAVCIGCGIHGPEVRKVINGKPSLDWKERALLAWNTRKNNSGDSL